MSLSPEEQKKAISEARNDLQKNHDNLKEMLVLRKSMMENQIQVAKLVMKQWEETDANLRRLVAADPTNIGNNIIWEASNKLLSAYITAMSDFKVLYDTYYKGLDGLGAIEDALKVFGSASSGAELAFKHIDQIEDTNWLDFMPGVKKKPENN
jgi:hypothetical protein